MSDAEIASTTSSMAKIKTWLRTNGVALPDGASDAALRAKVKRRQIRKSNNIPGHAPIRGVVAATSLTQFNPFLAFEK